MCYHITYIVKKGRGSAVKLLARLKKTLNAQLVTLSVMVIVLTVLIAMGSSLWLNLRSSHQMMDRSMMDVAYLLARTQDVRGLLEGGGDQSVTALLQQVVRRVNDLDVAVVIDTEGSMLAGASTRGGLQGVLQPDPDQTEPVFLQEGETGDGMERCACAKVFDQEGNLRGYAVVGVYMRSVYWMVAGTVLQYLLIAAVALCIGGFWARRLARYIKSELAGYEPEDLYRLMVQRADIWDALEEGVMAIDENERIIYLNAAAKQMLELSVDEAVGQPLHQVYSASILDRVLHSGKAEYNVPLKSLVHVKILADRMPIVKNGRTVGAVAIFRNRTEMVRLAEDLTGVNHVVEALRANTHEFMNKLHVILGLLQLEEYKEAERYVLELTKVRAQSMGGITGRIQEPAVAALLIGKLSRAQELRVVFRLDAFSHYPHGSRCLPTDAMISVLGNLIENAFDSFKNVADGAVREVEVCIQEEAQGLLICVEDTGCGIPPKVQQRMFEQGFSTKGQGRGTGLALVQSIVQAYGGDVRVESVVGLGTTFTIHIPPQEENTEDKQEKEERDCTRL